MPIVGDLGNREVFDPFGVGPVGTDIPTVKLIHLTNSYVDAAFFEAGIKFVAAAIDLSTVRVFFTYPLASVNTNITRYSISGPSVITINSVSWTSPDSYVTLSVSGTWQPGIYILDIFPETIFDAGNRSNEGSADFAQPLVFGGIGNGFNIRVN
jgi:hypothetical protein